MHIQINFWWTLVLYNILCFLPIYIINFKNQPNPFLFWTSKKISFGNKIKAFYYKISSDPFKAHFEYTALILLGQCFHWDGPLFLFIVTTLGGAGWIIILYSGIMHYVFHRQPVIKSDWQLIKYGLQMTYSQRYWVYPIIILIVAFVFTTSYLFTKSLIEYNPSINAVIMALFILIPLGLVKVFHIKYDRFIHRTVLSTILYSRRNWLMSTKYDYLINKDAAYFRDLSPVPVLPLLHRPNLHFICIESYGAVMFEDRELSATILPLLTNAYDTLKEKGYYIASGFSTSPQSGGGSWKCYSSLTYGLKIDDDLLYNLLFKSIDAFKEYKSLFHVLQDQGYKNYLLAPMGNYEKGTVDWNLIHRNFNADRYLTYDDMEYNGPACIFFGNTESPPDQYNINKASEILKKEHPDPYILFYTSLNSHYPFSTPTVVADDWNEVNREDFNLKAIKKRSQPLSDMYAAAIKYQLEVFLNWIESEDEEVYVLFGDHQPPFVKGVEGNASTPVHIICKNSSLLKPFLETGFVEGLIPKQEVLRHEGFMTLFLESMRYAYGADAAGTIAHQINGITFSNHAQNFS